MKYQDTKTNSKTMRFTKSKTPIKLLSSALSSHSCYNNAEAKITTDNTHVSDLLSHSDSNDAKLSATATLSPSHFHVPFFHP